MGENSWSHTLELGLILWRFVAPELTVPDFCRLPDDRWWCWPTRSLRGLSHHPVISQSSLPSYRRLNWKLEFESICLAKVSVLSKPRFGFAFSRLRMYSSCRYSYVTVHRFELLQARTACRGKIQKDINYTSLKNFVLIPKIKCEGIWNWEGEK